MTGALPKVMGAIPSFYMPVTGETSNALAGAGVEDP
jgi:hypothetical protein